MAHRDRPRDQGSELAVRCDDALVLIPARIVRDAIGNRFGVSAPPAQDRARQLIRVALGGCLQSRRGIAYDWQQP